MISQKTIGWLLVIMVFALMILYPELALAYEFETKTQNLTTNLITTVLPLLSTLGLVYAAILALTGDGAAKSRIITVVVCSIVGFLAPHFINWLKMAAGS